MDQATHENNDTPASRPEDKRVPVLATRDDVVLPGVIASLVVGRHRSQAAVKAALAADKRLLLVPQKQASEEDPQPSDLVEVGVLCEVMQMAAPEDGSRLVVLRSLHRMQIEEVVSHPGKDDAGDYWVARVEPFVSITPPDADELEQVTTETRALLAEVLGGRSDDPERIRDGLTELDDPDDLCDLAAAQLDLDRDLVVALLCEGNVVARMRLLRPPLEHQRQVTKVRARLRAELDKEETAELREQALRERARAIAKELGEDSDDEELDLLDERIDASEMSAEVRRVAKKQVGRMRMMSPGSGEYTVASTYVHWLLDLPWGKSTQDSLDVPGARRVLDADHAGLEEVKKRILQFVAVRKLAPEKQGAILCLVGPPGVGKTSLARSIAAALARNYVRVSLGGVRDEAEVRGHRRTYIGALPGRIATGVKQAGSMNPVFVLDEIDKLAHDFRGDPAAALLEVLDPEQNHEFSDHYLEVPLDLSRVLFVATANRVDTIPPALLDRMEVIQIPGYTEEEKLRIAQRHLLPRQLCEHGLEGNQVVIADDAVVEIIAHYTAEAGVRNLERELATLCRAVAVRVADPGGNGEQPHHITVAEVHEVLGPPRFTSELADSEPRVGVATGLSWTPLGGSIEFVETRIMPGQGKVQLTGMAGDVMKESVHTALSWVRTHAATLGAGGVELSKHDLHVHVPSGAMPHDGPSAGVSVAVALASLLSERAVRPEVAITGEITLRGRVLPVGGVKGKVLAAHRAGIEVVVLPEQNRKDTIDIPAAVLAEIELRFVSRAGEAVSIALAQRDEISTANTPSPLGCDQVASGIPSSPAP